MRSNLVALSAFPTDTFYALGVDAMNELAIRKAFEIKRRPATTPMPVLISEISQAKGSRQA